jgi:hypothetical protein
MYQLQGIVLSTIFTFATPIRNFIDVDILCQYKAYPN